MDYDVPEQAMPAKRLPAAELIARSMADKHAMARGGGAYNAVSTAAAQPAMTVVDRLNVHDVTLEKIDHAIGELFRRINNIDENLASIRNAVGLDPWPS